MNKNIKKFKGRNRYSGVRLIFSSILFVLVLLPAIYLMYDSGFDIKIVILCVFFALAAIVPLTICLVFTFFKWNTTIFISHDGINQREFGHIKRIHFSDINKIDYQYYSFFGKCYLSAILTIDDDNKIIIETKTRCFRFLMDECFNEEIKNDVKDFLF